MLARIGNPLGWGLFCTASWTWCIGMYLPIIMLRHWGWWGFVVFAVPNVLGCAGFGYLCSKPVSERLCREHAGAMVVFSAITVAYQMFFLAWFTGALVSAHGEPLSSPLPIGWLVPGGCIVVAVLLSLAPERAWPWLGALITCVSFIAWTQVGLAPLDAIPMGAHPDMPTAQSLWFAAPIIVFGFLLCPWLDRTFHRARQRTSSVHAFGVFGISFFVVILLTAAYGATGGLRVETLLPAVLAHVVTQLVFTIAVHVRELRLAPVPHTQRARQMMILLPAIGGVLAIEASSLFGIDAETTYLLFLGCYGLLFPAYVALFMPAGPRRWPLTRGRLALFGIVVLALAPLAARGFIALDTWLLPIPVALIALLHFALPAPRSDPSTIRENSGISGAPSPDSR